MRTTRTIRTMAAGAVLAAGLALGACDSEAEDQTEDLAEAVDESYEAEADMVSTMEQGGPNEDAALGRADQLREEGEQIKDDLENSADEMDDTLQ